MSPVDNGSMDAAYRVQTLPRTEERHVEPQEENRFVSLTVLFSLSVGRAWLILVNPLTHI